MIAPADVDGAGNTGSGAGDTAGAGDGVACHPKLSMGFSDACGKVDTDDTDGAFCFLNFYRANIGILFPRTISC